MLECGFLHYCFFFKKFRLQFDCNIELREFGLAQVEQLTFVDRRWQFRRDVVLDELRASLAMTFDELCLRREDVRARFAESTSCGVIVRSDASSDIDAERLQTPAAEARLALGIGARQRDAFVVAVVDERALALRAAQREQLLDDHASMPLDVASHRARQHAIECALQRRSCIRFGSSSLLITN